MRTVLFAYHDIGCAGLAALHRLGEEICAVFTHEDDPEENVWFGSVKKDAQKLGVPIFTPENVNQPEWVEKIRALRPDILFSFYYRRMISEEILRLAPNGGLNLHGSLLPKYRGRAPVNWALVNGEKETGLTLHYMVRKADAGDIVAQRKVAIAADDTALTLYRKLVPLTREILLETVPLLAQGKAPRTAQNSAQATHFGGRKPEDGRVDWTSSSEQIYNLVRAVTHPYPGAYTFLGGKKTFIWKSQKAASPVQFEAPARVVNLDPLTVSCGSGRLVLLRVQSEGQPELPGADWAAEHRIQPGSRLGE